MLFFKFVLIFVAIAFITAEDFGSKLACEFTLLCASSATKSREYFHVVFIAPCVVPVCKLKVNLIV
jgi:hypothetical protein